MNKVQKLSYGIRLSIQIGVFIYLAIFSISWIAIVIGYTEFTHEPLLHFINAAMNLIFSLGIAYLIIELFKAYEINNIFIQENAKRMAAIGYLLLAKQLFSPIYITFCSIILQRWMGLWGFNLQMILLSVIIIVHAWIISEAHKVNLEHQLTI